MLVSDIVRRNAEYFGEHDAVIVPGRRRSSWGELEVRTNRFANAMATLGLGKGDRLAIFAPNGGEYVDFFFGCAKAGIIGSAVNVRLAPEEIGAYLRYVQPSAALVHSELAKEAAEWLPDVPSLRHVIGLGAEHEFGMDLETLLTCADDRDPGVRVDDTDTYQLGATSGTTGLPKGAILTHRNAIAAMLNWAAEMPACQGGTALQNIPFFFNPGGPAGLHPVLLKGGRTVILPGFDPATFLRTVHEYQVTNTVMVPTMVQMVLAQPDCDRFDLSSLRGVTTGGAPLPRALLARARDVFGDVFFPFYGMAETYSNGLVLRQEDQFTSGTEAQLRRLGSAGKPHVLMQLRVVDADGEDVPHDNTTGGEIWMRGDSVSPGYFRLPEETERSRDGDWFASGDVAVVDEDGFVTIVDRKKDVIISGGINVFSGDVESVLLSHPKIAQAAVIGIPHDTWGEAIHAVLVAAPGERVDTTEVLSFAAERLAGFKKPRSAELVDALPMTATGKVLKRDLRAPYWQRR